MDALDLKLVRLLEDDARLSFAALAEAVSLSKSPCWNRVKTLEDRGIIRGYHAELDPGRLGLELEAFVQVSIDFDKAGAFEMAVRRHPLVRRCHATTGEADYLLQIMAESMSKLDTLLRDEVCRFPGVRRAVTSMVTREIKHNTSLAAAARTTMP